MDENMKEYAKAQRHAKFLLEQAVFQLIAEFEAEYGALCTDVDIRRLEEVGTSHTRLMSVNVTAEIR